MTTGSQAEFSRKYGYSKAAISQFKKAGRLVFASPGVLDFEASRQRIHDTADPNRADVAKRHATLRNPDNDEDRVTASSNSFQNARTVREKYLALQAKLDYEVNSGLLIEKSVVEKVLFERARQFRDGVMSTSRRIAPIIINKTSIKEVELIIDDELINMLDEFSRLPIAE